VLAGALAQKGRGFWCRRLLRRTPITSFSLNTIAPTAPTGDAPAWVYKGTSLIRNSLPLGPYGKPVPRVLGWS